jgi:pimeloyl-ACP methyl ester carboxylesterase
VLVAHSYGGMVATGVADRLPGHIRRIIYVDAFVPRDGQSLFDLSSADAVAHLRKGMADGDGWRVPPMPIPADTSDVDRQWIERFRMPQPLHCFDQKIHLHNADTQVPRSYIRALKRLPGDPFRQFAERAQQECWDCHEIDASHSPQVTAPEALFSLLDAIAG